MPVWASKGQGGLRSFMDGAAGRGMSQELRNQQKALVSMITTAGKASGSEMCRQHAMGSGLAVAAAAAAAGAGAGADVNDGECRDWARSDRHRALAAANPNEQP
eukprot:gene26670-38142_t